MQAATTTAALALDLAQLRFERDRVRDTSTSMFFIGGESASEASSLASSPSASLQRAPSSSDHHHAPLGLSASGRAVAKVASTSAITPRAIGLLDAAAAPVAPHAAAAAAAAAAAPPSSTAATTPGRAPLPADGQLPRAVSLQAIVPSPSRAETTLAPAPATTTSPAVSPVKPAARPAAAPAPALAQPPQPQPQGAARQHPLLKSRFPRAPDAGTRPSRIALAAAAVGEAAASSADIFFRREEVKPVVRPAKSLLSLQLRRGSSAPSSLQTPSAAGTLSVGQMSPPGTGLVSQGRSRNLAAAAAAAAAAPLPPSATTTATSRLHHVSEAQQQQLQQQAQQQPQQQQQQRDRKPLISVVARQLVPPGTKDEHLYDSSIFSFRSNVFGGW